MLPYLPFLYKIFRMETFSLWIVPERDAEKHYADAIYAFDSIGFRPHVTLCPSFKSKNLDDAKSIAIEIAKSLSNEKIELIFDEIDHSEYLFKSVFVRLKSTKSLIKASKIAREIISLSRSYERRDEAFDPHVSIAYGERSRDERESIVKKLTGMLQKITAKNKYALVSCASSLALVRTTTRERYDLWSIDLEIPLRE